MHDSSYAKMAQFVDKYLDPDKTLKVLDVGSHGLTGSYRDIFKQFEYVGCDIVPGPNVDFVVNGPYEIQSPSETYDVVISGQAMEHVEYPWVWIMELSRVLKNGGLMCIIAPGSGPLHDVKDYWRFHPDGMEAIAKWAGLTVLETRMTQENEWWDCMLVARR